MTSESEQNAKSLNELSDHLLRQLRGGSGGGFSEGRWGGSRALYGSSSFYLSSGEGLSTGGFIAIIAVIGVVGICYYCYVMYGKNEIDPSFEFEAAVNAERDRGGHASIIATVHKSSQRMKCGIEVKLQNDSVTIISMDSDGLFANSGLEVGMAVKTINDVSVIGKTAAEATQLIENAVDQVTIVAIGSQSTDLNTGSHPPFQTCKGTFDISYVDRGKQCRGHVILELKNNGRFGYRVLGTKSDVDGTAFITEGFVNYEGDAWWVDELHSGNDMVKKVLTKGKFDWLTDSFEGTWRANTGISGRFSSFESANVTKTFAPSITTTTVANAAPAIPPVNQSHTQTPAVTAVAESESSSPVIVAATITE